MNNAFLIYDDCFMQTKTMVSLVKLLLQSRIDNLLGDRDYFPIMLDVSAFGYNEYVYVRTVFSYSKYGFHMEPLANTNTIAKPDELPIDLLMDIYSKMCENLPHLEGAYKKIHEYNYQDSGVSFIPSEYKPRKDVKKPIDPYFKYLKKLSKTHTTAAQFDGL